MKRAKKQNKDLEKLFDAVSVLANGEKLDESYRDHDLTGDYAGTREWQSYIGELERAVNGEYKRWYHLTREWKADHPEEYDHYLKLKKKRPDQAEQYRLRGWKDVNIRPHDLRHSFCEWCITNGIDPKTVSNWMGHADQKMIMQVYDHVTNERETKAIEKLNGLFSTKSDAI